MYCQFVSNISSNPRVKLDDFSQISSWFSIEMKYMPVAVLFVEFVCTVFPPFNAPFSTTPPPGTGFRERRFAPLKTVKLAKLISFGFLLTMVGRPK